MKSPVQSFFNIEKTIASESAYRDYSTKHNQTREQLKFRRFGGPASKRARAAACKYQPAAARSYVSSSSTIDKTPPAPAARRLRSSRR